MSWRRFFRRTQWDLDRAEELRSYLEIETDANIAQGMSPDDARRAAHLKLGNRVAIREQIFQMNTIGLLDSLWSNLRLAVRGIRRRPTFAAAVILTLALGIGANTAIFAVVHGVLLKPLAYPNAEELVSVEQVAPGLDVAEFRLSASQYVTYREHGRVFQHIGVWGDGGMTITGLGDPEQARALVVTEDVLPALGVPPLLGRWFTGADGGLRWFTGADGGLDAAARPRAIILSYGYWQRRFGGDRSVIGRRLVIDSNPAEVVGVMPEGFRFLDIEPAAEVIGLFTINRTGLTLDNFGLRAIARLKPGLTAADADADIARMLPIWFNAWPESPGALNRKAIEGWRIAPAVQPLKDDVVGNIVSMLWVLMATIGMVLLIACANVANLMLVRSEGRRQEFAVRTALGAGRGQIAREVFVESVVLAVIGGALGLAIAYAGLQLVIQTAPATLPRVEDISLDPRVLGFAVVVSLVSSLLFGIVPALKRSHEGSLLGGATRGASTSRERQRTRNALVVVQVALAVVLLVGSGLMIRTFQALQNIEPGFSVASVQTARINVLPSQAREPERITRIQQEILDRVSAIPGVTAAGFATAVPMEAGREFFVAALVDGQTYEAGTTPPLRRQKRVSPGYFRAIGTRLVAGRDITWNDIDRRTRVAIISENFAREVWGSASAALGERIREPAPTNGPPVWREIVGVAEDVYEDALHQPAPAMVYWPILMENFGGLPLAGWAPVNLVIRSEQAGNESLLGEVRKAVSSVNPSMPVFLTRTMQNLYDTSMARTSFALVMLAIAGIMALALGVVGIYGVMAYVVSQRSREIGIRLALGARPADLKRLFVRQGLTLAAVGAVAGMVTAGAATQWMSSLLFGVERLDLPTYAAVLGVLGVAAALASYVPARRAAGVDPVNTLTAE